MPPRTPLPHRRHCVRQAVRIGLPPRRLYVEVGLRLDGTPGEVFLTLDRTGTAERAWIDTVARLVSHLLQHDAPLDSVIALLRDTKFAPCGVVTGDEAVKFASSPLDYVGKWLEAYFGPHAAPEPDSPSPEVA